MDYQTIVMCIFSLMLGILFANILKNICRCKVVEGQECDNCINGRFIQSGGYHQGDLITNCGTLYGGPCTQQDIQDFCVLDKCI